MAAIRDVGQSCGKERPDVEARIYACITGVLGAFPFSILVIVCEGALPLSPNRATLLASNPTRGPSHVPSFKTLRRQG